MMSDYLPAFLGLSEDGNWTRSGGIDVRLAHATILVGFADIRPVIAAEEASRQWALARGTFQCRV